MKSQIFKTAWQIFRTQKVSFSNALTMAWEFARKVKVVVQLTWNKVEITSYNINVKNGFKGASGTLAGLFTSCLNYVKNDSTGAKFDYGFGLYNGD